MANCENSKTRLLAIYNMIAEGKKITADQIIERLRYQYGISTTRKTITSDMYAIERFIPIEANVGRNGGYKKQNFYDGD